MLSWDSSPSRGMCRCFPTQTWRCLSPRRGLDGPEAVAGLWLLRGLSLPAAAMSGGLVGADASHALGVGGQTCMRHVPRRAARGWQHHRPGQENCSASAAAASPLAGGRTESPSGGGERSCRQSGCFALLNSAQHYYFNLFFFFKGFFLPLFLLAFLLLAGCLPSAFFPSCNLLHQAWSRKCSHKWQHAGPGSLIQDNFLPLLCSLGSSLFPELEWGALLSPSRL